MFNLINIQKALKEAAEESVDEMPLHISTYLGFGKRNEGLYRNTTSKLESNTGDLYRSFQRGDVNNITDIKYTKDGTNIEFGSKLKYATTHEFGATIKATPVTVIRKFNPNAKKKLGAKIKPFQTFQMARYFWAKYFQTNQDEYKFMALYVHKKGGIVIKKRPYFNPALNDFATEGLPLILENLLNKILNSNE